MKPENHEKADVVCEIANAIKPHLSGAPPEVISVVLSDLVATFIAGWPPAARDDIFSALVDQARALVHLNELLIFGPAGHSANKGVRP
ncbi:hypothetical protein [Sinorhizobium medicae]|uniref:hypothetical protein n=1 Tax=Sinorhizobium medicae TaxID=110321 RepID=UPI000FD34308|nr:hypothetical protein [Sinorhizobium medicae]MDX0662641.1 hypothetical protein [Sinorhizobium medicae]MDX0773588.1 hypothetical protein [Sinorhizobium medicae]MDX0884034.1 hypothetical protein [Sinorhizobium medicae]MDX0889450.1 hypothetical protein [Sinorhizobium medicae]MDX0978309.1 hypothetical protein [Sinorhizobium medicae]